MRVLAIIESVGTAVAAFGAGLATLSISADYGDEVSLVGSIIGLLGSVVVLGVKTYRASPPASTPPA